MNKDLYYFNAINSAESLSDKTKELYIKKIKKIQTEFWNLQGKSEPKSIDYIISNPDDFFDKLKKYVKKTKGRVYTKLGDHSKEEFCKVIIILFKHAPELKTKKPDQYEKWQKIMGIIKKPITNKYLLNIPTKRQKKAFVPFDKIVQVRDSLQFGSLERLLLSMYTLISPVRADYYRTKIKLDSYSGEDGNNYINLAESKLVLQKYKTQKKYGTIVIDLPSELEKEIRASLKLMPREYLFVSTADGLPYTSKGVFTNWANRTLKRVLNNDAVSLTILRHSYISRRDLKLEKKSGLEQNKIARQMGHSLLSQKLYNWHKWEFIQ